jgi:hypothetical protein
MYSDEEEDFTSPDEGSDSEPMLGKSTKSFSPNLASLGGRIFFLFQNLLLKKVIKCTVLEVDE